MADDYYSKIMYEKLLSDEQIARNSAITKFKMFFAGLIFAILSFLATHQVTGNNFYKTLEIISEIFLLFSGIIILAQLNYVCIMPQNPEKLTPKMKSIINFINLHLLDSKLIYWVLFLLGMTLMILNRGCSMFS